MNLSTRIAIPTLVRMKVGALARLGIYLSRFNHQRIAVLQSAELPADIVSIAKDSLARHDRTLTEWTDIDDHSFLHTIQRITSLRGRPQAIVGLGGGKALDVAKYIAFLTKLPYFAVPTSLSNDGFSSPQSSLTVEGKRRSFAASMPFGVVVDTEVCLRAPKLLTLSGIGDLAAKFTAIQDWKLAFHHHGESVDDFAALLSDGSVHAFMARPNLDTDGIRLLATSLMLNGIAMEVCGSSRPASGSEHLISHALDEIASAPRLHGIQVGVATYLVSLLQGLDVSAVDQLFESTGFWQAVYNDPFPTDEWLRAVQLAPTIKPDFFTVLATRDVLPEVKTLLKSDPRLARCFKD